MQGTTEAATTDGFGVIRSGAYGTKLSSTFKPLRGDLGLEQSLLQVATSAVNAVVLAPITGLDDPFTKPMCRALCNAAADANGNGRVGPLEGRAREACLAACERVKWNGTKRMFCMGLEATLKHVKRHGEDYKNIKDKQLVEAILVLYNSAGCPGDLVSSN